MRIKYTVVKKIIYCICAFILAASCILFSACNLSEEESCSTVKVSIVESLFFTADKTSADVVKGEDLTVILTMIEGYVPTNCDYSSYTINEVASGEYALTLKNVERPARVTVTSQAREKEVAQNAVTTCSITFDYNNGTGVRQTVDYELSYHIRPNTINGSGISYEGYVLIGWNTKADGTGEHVGLGSRYTVADGQTAVLYGEWAQCLPESDFVYSVQSDGSLILTGYRGSGDGDLFVIPNKIGGKTVSAVGSSFTTNIPCGTLTSKTLVLPDTIITVADNAFKNSSFTEIFFFDNLQQISGKAFSGNISTYHVNAAVEPCLQSINYNTRFADNIDILIVNKDSKKMIFFAGCSFTYGLDSSIVDEAFNGEYAVVNAGINGEFNALFQLEIMLPYINDGDILVHAPEQMSAYQFMSSMRLDGRAFAIVEGNYDLLASADFSYSDSVLDAYMMYNNLRNGQEECSYSDYYGYFNKYGDYIEDRPYDEGTESERDVSYSQYYIYDLDLLTEENIAALAAIYARFEERGATVYFSYAPMNENSLESDVIYEKAAAFQSKLNELIAPYGYKIISEITDYIYKGRYFYDTDYHLNDYGVILRTQQLIADLKAAGVA